MEMESGYIVVLGKKKISRPYELDQGNHTIGGSVDSNIRLKFFNPLLLDTHAIIRVNHLGVATVINKSTAAPIKVNGKTAFKPTILRHQDKFQVLEKEFQYFNEKLKDEPEESEIFVQEKKTILASRRKSVMPLSKTPAKAPTYKIKSPAKTLSRRLLNKSLGAPLSRTPRASGLNRTFSHSSTKPSFVVLNTSNNSKVAVSNRASKRYSHSGFEGRGKRPSKSGNVENRGTTNEDNLNMSDDSDESVISLRLSPGPLEVPVCTSDQSVVSLADKGKKSSSEQGINKSLSVSRRISERRSVRSFSLSTKGSTMGNDSDLGVLRRSGSANSSNISKRSEQNVSGSLQLSVSAEDMDRTSSSQISTVQNSRETSRSKSASRSFKGMETFDESTQDANYSGLKEEKCRSDDLDEIPATQNVDDESLSTSRRISQRRSINSFSLSTQGTTMRNDPNLSAVRQSHSATGEPKQNLSRRSIQNFDRSSSSQISAVQNSRETSRSRSCRLSKGMETFDESTQDANFGGAKDQSKLSGSVSDEIPATQNVDESVSLEESEKDKKRSTSFLQQASCNKSLDTTRRISIRRSISSALEHSTGDEPKQRSLQNDASRSIKGEPPSFLASSQISTVQNSRVDTASRSSKSMGTFDESTQDVVNFDGSKDKSKQPFTSNSKRMTPISVSDDSVEVLSPVQPLSVQPNNTTGRRSSSRRSLKGQTSGASSLTVTSLDESTGSVISVSSQSFSSFKKENDGHEDTEIDVVNFTVETNTPEAKLNVRFSLGQPRTPLAVENRQTRRSSSAAVHMFADVTCTSTPFHKPLVNKDGHESSTTNKSNRTTKSSTTPMKTPSESKVFTISSTDATLNSPKVERSSSASLSGVDNTDGTTTTSRRRSSRSSTSKIGEHNCISCRHSSVKRSRSLSATSDVLGVKSMQKSTSSVEKSAGKTGTTPLLHRQSHIEDETPKSHVKPARRSSKANQSTYNPVLEDITPVTPEKLQVSGFTETFKTPINTPGLFESIRKSVVRSRKRRRDSSGSALKDSKRAKMDYSDENEHNLQSPTYEVATDQVKRERKSPLNRLSNFEGIKKLMKTPQKSPKNDLRNVPNLRKIMSPKHQKSPRNDLTSPYGVKKLLTQKDPVNDLTNVSGVADIFNGSDIENSEDLFTKLTGKRPVRAYHKNKSLSPAKADDGAPVSRKTMGDLPVCSPRVQMWVEEHANYNLDGDVKSESKKRKRGSVAVNKSGDQCADVAGKRDYGSRTARSMSMNGKVSRGADRRRNTQWDLLGTSPDVEQWKNEELGGLESVSEQPSRKPRVGRSMSAESNNQAGGKRRKTQWDGVKGSPPDVNSWLTKREDAEPTDQVSGQPSRKPRVGRSMSAEKNNYRTGGKRRQTQWDNVTGTPDVNRWLATRKCEDNDLLQRTPTDQVDEGLESVSGQPNRKPRVGRSMSAEKNNYSTGRRRRQTQWDSAKGTPDVNRWLTTRKSEDNDLLQRTPIDQVDEGLESVSGQPSRKPRVGRSMSAEKNNYRTGGKRRQTQWDNVTGTPDVNRWLTTRKSEDNDLLQRTPTDRVDDGLESVAGQPNRKPRVGRSMSAEKNNQGGGKRRKTQWDNAKRTPDVADWIAKRESEYSDALQRTPTDQVDDGLESVAGQPNRKPRVGRSMSAEKNNQGGGKRRQTQWDNVAGTPDISKWMSEGKSTISVAEEDKLLVERKLPKKSPREEERVVKDVPEKSEEEVNQVHDADQVNKPTRGRPRRNVKETNGEGDVVYNRGKRGKTAKATHVEVVGNGDAANDQGGQTPEPDRVIKATRGRPRRNIKDANIDSDVNEATTAEVVENDDVDQTPDTGRVSKTTRRNMKETNVESGVNEGKRGKTAEADENVDQTPEPNKLTKATRGRPKRNIKDTNIESDVKTAKSKHLEVVDNVDQTPEPDKVTKTTRGRSKRNIKETNIESNAKEVKGKRGKTAKTTLLEVVDVDVENDQVDQTPELARVSKTTRRNAKETNIDGDAEDNKGKRGKTTKTTLLEVVEKVDVENDQRDETPEPDIVTKTTRGRPRRNIKETNTESDAKEVKGKRGKATKTTHLEVVEKVDVENDQVDQTPELDIVTKTTRRNVKETNIESDAEEVVYNKGKRGKTTKTTHLEVAENVDAASDQVDQTPEPDRVTKTTRGRPRRNVKETNGESGVVYNGGKRGKTAKVVESVDVGNDQVDQTPESDQVTKKTRGRPRRNVKETNTESDVKAKGGKLEVITTPDETQGEVAKTPDVGKLANATPELTPRATRAKRGANKKYSVDEYEVRETRARPKKAVHFEGDEVVANDTPEVPTKRTLRRKK